MTQAGKPGDAPEADKLDVGAEIEEVPNPTLHADVPVIAAATKSAAILESGKSSKRAVLDGIVTLLGGETITDEVDRKIIADAVEFIQNSPHKLADVERHSLHLLMVSSGYDEQGLDTPDEIQALVGYVLFLECFVRMNFIEGEIARGAPDSPEVEAAITLCGDQSITLSKNFGIDYILDAVAALRERLPKELQDRIIKHRQKVLDFLAKKDEEKKLPRQQLLQLLNKRIEDKGKN